VSCNQKVTSFFGEPAPVMKAGYISRLADDQIRANEDGMSSD